MNSADRRPELIEREIETVREKPHWSYSALQTYLTCPMRYYFRYIEHAEVERTPISIPFGRAFHLVLSERALKGTSYTIVDAKEDFAVYFRGETEVCENLTYKQDEDYWFWDKRGCDMLEVALADWPDDYTVKSVAEAFSVEVPGLSKPLVGEFDLVTVDGGDETICDWKTASTNWPKGKADRDLQATTFAYAYMKKYGELEKIGCWGTWEPCHKTMLGHGIVGVENLGGDLDKIPAGVPFRFNCFPLRWYMGDGSMARCVAEIDEDLLDKSVPDRTYAYGGTGYGFPEGNGDSGLEYMQRLFNRNKKKK